MSKPFDDKAYASMTNAMINEAERAKAMKDGEKAMSTQLSDEKLFERLKVKRKGRFQGKKHDGFWYDRLVEDEKELLGRRKGAYICKPIPSLDAVLVMVRRKAKKEARA